MLRDGSDEVSDDLPLRTARAPGVAVVPWLYGLVTGAGLVMLCVDPYEDFGVMALIAALPYLVWWAALERPSATPRLSLGRRVLACVFVSLVLAFVAGTVVAAVGDAVDADTGSPLYLGLGALAIACCAMGSGARCWQILGDVPPLAGARRLLGMITRAATVALLVGLPAALIAQSRGTMLAGLLAAVATGSAAVVLGWTVLPWLRHWWFAARTPFGEV